MTEKKKTVTENGVGYAPKIEPTEKKKTWTYKVEDIFEDILDDPENMTMTIPEEIRDQIGLKPGDNIKILIGDLGTLIIEKV
jgi:AbrB family looped-hinge helix DNA binding protein|tara:strand:+ start:3438 stop:3683 length:246 start_codon:yes stop_codon:yes gene_type:complete